MGLFSKKKDLVIDLGEHYKKRQEALAKNSQDTVDLGLSDSGSSSESSSDSGGGFFGGFFGNANSDSGNSNSTSSETESSNVFGDTVNPDEKRRRLAKRLQEMTDKLEKISNQVYHLEQRMEVVERKLNVNSY